MLYKFTGNLSVKSFHYHWISFFFLDDFHFTNNLRNKGIDNLLSLFCDFVLIVLPL